MRVVNSFFKTLTDYDLEKGYLVDAIALKEEAESKTEWVDTDYEEVKMYFEYSKPTQEITLEQRTEALEKAMLEMMGVSLND